MSKYYTPEIEEFHVGFEYEILEMGSKTKYHPATLNDCDDLTGDYDGLTLLYEIASKRHLVRVKHLDREDIESLGFKRDLMRGNNVFSKSHPKNKSIITTLRTYFEMDKGRVTLSSNARMFIDVDLKNKSELKRLLKQLGI